MSYQYNEAVYNYLISYRETNKGKPGYAGIGPYAGIRYDYVLERDSSYLASVLSDAKVLQDPELIAEAQKIETYFSQQ